MNWMINNIQLTWKLAWMLRTYTLMVRFSKYEFYNKLLRGVILLRVILGITWIQPYVCVCLYIYKIIIIIIIIIII